MGIKSILKKCPLIVKAYRSYCEYKSILCTYWIPHKKNELISCKYRRYPLQNKIVFNNFQGRGYGCNPKYIAEAFLKLEQPWDLVWLVEDMNTPMPEGIRKVKFYGEESFYELATAKVIINNVKGDLNFRKRKGQLYIQTWHGSYGFKFVEKDAIDKLPADYIWESKDNSKITDLFLSNSPMLTEQYRSAFWCKCEILEKGLPRMDYFFREDAPALKQKIRKNLGLPDGVKLAMYAPTFRGGDDSLESYGMDYETLSQALVQRFGGEWKILSRLHPNIKQDTVESANYLDVSKYPDMQELLLLADVLISDYSSSMFEFAVMEKPVFIYANDVEEYCQLRGINPVFYELSFPRAESNEQLSQAILNFDEERYSKDVAALNAKFASFDDGHASEAVVEYVLNWDKNRQRKSK